MKKQLLAGSSLLLCLALAACTFGGAATGGAAASGGQVSPSTGGTDQTSKTPASSTGSNFPGEIFLKFQDQSFKIILYHNETTQALLALLPLSIDMDDLYGNEKYCYLAKDLPTDPVAVKNINTGDVMLYGSNCLALFYDGFSTPYSYTKLGYIEEADEFAALLSDGKITVELTPASG